MFKSIGQYMVKHRFCIHETKGKALMVGRFCWMRKGWRGGTAVQSMLRVIRASVIMTYLQQTRSRKRKRPHPSIPKVQIHFPVTRDTFEKRVQEILRSKISRAMSPLYQHFSTLLLIHTNFTKENILKGD